MKRLLCILSNMNAGGAETFLMKVYRNIDKSKYQFDFCLSSAERSFYESEIEKLGGRVFHIEPKTDNFCLFKKKLYNIVKDNDYQYVLRITANATGFIDLKIAKEAGAKTCIGRSSNSNDEGKLKNKMAHTLGKYFFLKYVDKAISPSKLAAKYTFGKNCFETKNVSILHNGLDIEQYKFTQLGRKQIRREFKIREDAVVIGNIGRFMIQKNHKLIVDIFFEIYKLNSRAVLLLVGTGELLEDIKKQVRGYNLDDNVIFAGVRSDIPSILSAMDVLLMPSLYEGMPNVVIEAQATGLPCVISDTITEEADITGLLKYVSLNEKIDTWANCVLNSVSVFRENTQDKFISNGYDIASVTNQFVQLVFGDIVNED